MTHDEYVALNIGERVLFHSHREDGDPLYEGIVVKRDVMPAGAVVIGVLVPIGDERTWVPIGPADSSMHRLPFTGTEACNYCTWRKLEYLAGDQRGAFTGEPPER